MMKISEIAHQYSGSLTDDQKDLLYSILKNVKSEELKTIEDHRTYIEILAHLRKSLMRGMRLMGQKFLDTLESLLSVGEDGAYSNKLRFLYELIQNVDDCDYDDPTDCHLDIQFCYEKSPGLIIFTYNEKGFKPENVFAITGIAEASKNISADKMEIGEKGIGFKSVFGIADKVLIQSGMFSFALNKNNFTVPVPCYDNYKPVHGTRLVLEMSPSRCENIYRELVNKYIQKNSILKENPILFLNKLTHLRMYFDEFRSIEFNVQRISPEIKGKLQIEKDISISVDMKDYKNGYEQVEKNEIYCCRYTMPIVYGNQECISRYGKDASFSERRHNLIAILPVSFNDIESYRGILYSFLPTQIKINAPLVLHVPFKLDLSREFVDPQEKDGIKSRWFLYTVAKLSEFIKLVYTDFATIVKQDIVRYLPTVKQYLFQCDNSKIKCLCLNELHGCHICRENVFYTESGNYRNASSIIAFGKNEQPDAPEEVYRLLKPSGELFIPGSPVDMKQYGVSVITDIPKTLFSCGLQHINRMDEILTWLDNCLIEFNYSNLIRSIPKLDISGEMLKIIDKHSKLVRACLDLSKERISRLQIPQFHIVDDVKSVNDKRRNEIIDLVNDADLDANFIAYLKTRKYRFCKIDTDSDFVLAGDNAIVLSENNELGSFSRLSKEFDSRGTFSATLTIRQASEKLNQVDDSMSNEEYLKFLRSVRNSLKDAFGKKTYDSYVRIVLEVGTDKNRFLGELLQNADDCNYPTDILPEFSLEIDDNKLEISYNEIGFTKDNVRALTAIGESTKKQLLSGNDRSIGEKGIGFKSVFGVAESVEIHSNGFNFILTDKQPTIPKKCTPINDTVGTRMIFQMKKDIHAALSVEKILKLCLCLHNLRRLKIAGHEISIDDDDKSRNITIDDKQKYTYQRIEYDFEVRDVDALKERNSCGRIINPKQQIICYIPDKTRGQDMFLYSGLPTEIESLVPLIIDAPFELTTSREGILKNKWNEIIKQEMYNAILHVVSIKKDSGLDALRYVGFNMRSGILTWGNFSDSWLNSFDWRNRLRQLNIFPVLGGGYTSLSGCRCVLIPEFIAKMNNTNLVRKYFTGTVIDIRGKSQYASLLENLGCQKATGAELSRFLKSLSMSQLLDDDDFRKGLYAYLSNNQGNYVFDSVGEAILSLPVFPVRTVNGTEYISYNENLYSHSTKHSENGFYILDDKIMSCDMARKILGNKGHINVLTQEVFDLKYQKTLEAKIEAAARTGKLQSASQFLLNEFTNNRSALSKCRSVLLGLRDKVPMEMSDGHYKIGSKFLNSNEHFFGGDLVPRFVVSDRFSEFAKYLDLQEIESIHPDDIDLDLDDITDEDIEDLQYGVNDYYGLIKFFVNQGLVSDEQIAKYNLEFAEDNSDDDYGFEEFPEKSVKNFTKLQNHIKAQWRNPNPYIEKNYVRWQPTYELDKISYTENMYRSINNPNKCFCQMCKRKYKQKYIERNDIEKNPAYAWEQMHLSLCLHCSKDYVYLRNNNVLWNQFINRIMQENVMKPGSHDITIGDRTISFTATHLAEIQEIFKSEGWGDDAPKRKSKLGKTVDTEDSD